MKLWELFTYTFSLGSQITRDAAHLTRCILDIKEAADLASLHTLCHHFGRTRTETIYYILCTLQQQSMYTCKMEKQVLDIYLTPVHLGILLLQDITTIRSSFNISPLSSHRIRLERGKDGIRWTSESNFRTTLSLAMVSSRSHIHSTCNAVCMRKESKAKRNKEMHSYEWANTVCHLHHCLLFPSFTRLFARCLPTTVNHSWFAILSHRKTIHPTCSAEKVALQSNVTRKLALHRVVTEQSENNNKYHDHFL